MTTRSEEILRRLVAFDTTSHRSTREIADYICSLADRPGVRIERDPTPDGEKENLLLIAGPQEEDRRDGLVLSGHLDVVPAEEPEWRSDPFVLTRNGDSWVGRGTSDMKGFLALALDRFLKLDPATLTAPLMLLFTHDEEIGTRGAQRFAEGLGCEIDLPRAAVIGEPTSLRVVRLHKGHLRLRVHLKGKSAHSGYPHRGKSAIEAAGRAVQALTELRERLAEERGPFSEFFGEVPFVTLNQGQIHGGSAVNVIPEACSIEVGLRPLPGDRASELTERVRACLAAALGGDDWELEAVNDSAPLETPEAAGISRVLCERLGQTETASASFASDAGPLSALGIEAVLFGPGSIEVAHRPNEFLPCDEFSRAGKILEDLVGHYCGGETA